MKSNCFLSLVSLVVLTVGMSGCATKTEQPQSKNNPNSTPAKSVSTRLNSNQFSQQANAQFDLTGVWVGTSGLDREALNAKLASLDGKQREDLEYRVRIFDSIFMAYQFNADQSMEIDMELVMPNQEKFQEQAFGQWKTAAGDNGSLLVTTIETRENAEPETTTKQYFIISENEFQIIPTNIAPELADLSPFYLFQRQSVESIPLSAKAPVEEVLK